MVLLFCCRTPSISLGKNKMKLLTNRVSHQKPLFIDLAMNLATVAKLIAMVVHSLHEGRRLSRMNSPFHS